MLKTIYNIKALCVMALLGSVATVSAQEDKTKEKNLNREMTLEREYDPTVQDASKVNTLPVIKEPVGKKMAIDYATFTVPADPEKEFFEDAFGKAAKMDGIARPDWLAYLGPAAPAYLAAYSQMQLQKSKVSMSFSAMLFGPFYFFYRKAWKPAFGFLAAELVVALPTLLSMMQATGSPLTAGISSTAIVVLSRIMTVFSFALVMLRTLYAKWLYRKSAAERIRRIRAEFPDAAQRRAVLSAQGGVSIAGVIGAFVLLMVLGACATVLMGPNLDALAGML